MTIEHHTLCPIDQRPGPDVETCIAIEVGRRSDGTLVTAVRFATGDVITAEAGDPDVGLTEPHTVLHDAAHTILACLLGLDRSPVLERVADLRPLTQRDVDLEEAAAFALQAWCASLRGDESDVWAAVANVRTALDRLDIEPGPFDR